MAGAPKAETPPAIPTYTAPHKVYVDGLLVEPGEYFTTAATKGAQWEEVPAPRAD